MFHCPASTRLTLRRANRCAYKALFRPTVHSAHVSISTCTQCSLDGNTFRLKWSRTKKNRPARQLSRNNAKSVKIPTMYTATVHNGITLRAVCVIFFFTRTGTTTSEKFRPSHCSSPDLCRLAITVAEIQRGFSPSSVSSALKQINFCEFMVSPH